LNKKLTLRLSGSGFGFIFVTSIFAVTALATLAIAGWTWKPETPPPEGFTTEEWALIKTLSPLPALPPLDPSNQFADDPRAAKLGQKFFFEKGISGPIVVGNDGKNGGLGAPGETGKISCASCHQPDSKWMFDIRSNTGVEENPHATALGAGWMLRNVSSIINTAYYNVWRENDGVSDSPWADALTDPEDPHSQNGSRLQVAHVIWDKYRAEYDAVFHSHRNHARSGHTPNHLDALDARLDPRNPHAAELPATGKPGDKQWEAMPERDKEIVNHIFANFGKAVQAYLRKCVSRNAPFDRYVAGDHTAINTAAVRGLRLFISPRTNCVQCHLGPMFTDSRFHTIGMHVDTTLSPHADASELGRYSALQQVLSHDPGTTGQFNVDSIYSDNMSTGILSRLAATEADKGKWRTKSLRLVAVTPPYMHTGQMPTLRDVIDFYNHGGDAEGTFIGSKDLLIHPLHLTSQEKQDLIAFLETLTGDPLPDELMRDTSARSMQ